MSVGHYLAGVLFLGLTLGGSVFAAQVVRRRRFGHLTGAYRIVAQALLSTVALMLTVFVPGVLGLLTRGTAAGIGVLLAGTALLTPTGGGHADAPDPDPDPPPSSRAGLAIASLAVLAAAAVGVGEFLHQVSTPMTAGDLTSFDLPVIARWIQTGSLWHLTELYPLQTHGTYPQNAHLVVTAMVLAFHNDALIRYLCYPFLGMAAVAAYATAVEVGARRSQAATLAAALVVMPTVTTTLEFAVDPIALAMFVTGLAFLLRHRRTNRSSDLMLAGLGLGLAAGAFWYYTDAVVALALLWVVWRWRSVGSVASALREGVSLAGVIAACCGFWLLRNLVLTGDPVYPVRVAVGGLTLFGAPHDVYRALFGFNIVHYIDDGTVLRHYLIPALTTLVGGLGAVAIIAVGWALMDALRASGARRSAHPMERWLAITGIVLAVIYVLTPYSAYGLANRPTLAEVNVRYLIPALAVATALTAAIAGRASARIQLVVQAATLAAVLQEAHETYTILGIGRLSLLAGAALVVAAATGVLWSRGSRAIKPPFSWVLAGLAVVSVVAIAYGTQRSYNRERYAPYDATYAWIQHHPGTLTVGLGGSRYVSGPSPAWAMFGPRLANRVSFVGRVSHGDHVTQYQTGAQWLRALTDGRYDVVEIARDEIVAATTDKELAWAKTAKLPVLSESSGFELVCAAGLWSAGSQAEAAACR
jgi:hypothetical protein